MTEGLRALAEACDEWLHQWLIDDGMEEHEIEARIGERWTLRLLVEHRLDLERNAGPPPPSLEVYTPHEPQTGDKT